MDAFRRRCGTALLPAIAWLLDARAGAAASASTMPAGRGIWPGGAAAGAGRAASWALRKGRWASSALTICGSLAVNALSDPNRGGAGRVQRDVEAVPISVWSGTAASSSTRRYLHNRVHTLCDAQ